MIMQVGWVRVTIISTLEKGDGPLLNKLKFPLPKDALCQVWLKLTCPSGSGEDFHMSSMLFCFFAVYFC